MAREVTRRQLLGRASTAAAGLAGLSIAGCSSRLASASMPTPGGTVVPDAGIVDGYRRFVTRPDLNPPVVTFTRKVEGSQALNFFLNAPYTDVGRGGAMILDQNGDLIWMGPDTPTAHRLDFNTQVFQGKPALTWWEGIETHGWGQGVAVVADSSYQTRHVIHAHSNPKIDRVPLKVDHHEFNVTPEGHALVTCYRTRYGVDLRKYGGPKHGVIASGVCQQIDIATGDLIWEWDSYDHVHLDESYQPFRYKGRTYGIESNPFDYFHINSLAPTADGNLLISSRNCWTVFKVNRGPKADGAIMWRLNGKKNDFNIGNGVHFYWQHHVRPHPDNLLTIFDNGGDPLIEKQSRALILVVDEDSKRATLRHSFKHPKVPLSAQAMGSTQLLPNGNVVVGWGTNPYFSEFAPDGTEVVAAQMTDHNPSYRVFGAEWEGHPTKVPDIAVRRSQSGTTVYASWNGSTSLASWTILAGKSRTSLAQVGSAHRQGFETAIAVRSTGPYFAVQAHDAQGNVLAKSGTVKLR
jgi:Arylsulfotransferase (ASST)